MCEVNIMIQKMMSKSQGDIESAIWLLGDSNPQNWQNKLQEPLDSRHPARHNIWSPVLLEIQDRVFASAKLHVDQNKFYVRNAIENPQRKPAAGDLLWSGYLQQAVKDLSTDMNKHHPQVVFSFGAFSFEFARRAVSSGKAAPYNAWNTRTLGEQFREAIKSFDPTVTNIIPLLHVSISRGKFIESHDNFCNSAGGNYFLCAGKEIAAKFLQFRSQLKIWVD
jgi:hypothetical protein